MKNTTYFENLSWLALSVEDGDISASDFDIAKDFEFFIGKEDIGLFVAQMKELVDIRTIKRVTYGCTDCGNFDGTYDVTFNNEQIKEYGFKCGHFGLEEIKD